MLSRSLEDQRNMSPVNTWPWRGWQVCRGSRGLKGG
jgi:hypothetical protein